ncbi:MAG TPA: DNA polymerase II, partial [Acidilobales archaeon]|nr:DNA polymerase II [Acidilobales archaeon]
MNIKAYLLDVSYEVVGREPHILLWCIDEGGRRILLRDKTFRPYFYVLPEDESVARQVALSIRRLSKPRSPIIKVEIVGKKYYGRPVKAIRVTTVIPETVREYREEVKKIRGVREVLEADIRFAMRYLIDKGITPCSWFEVEVEEVNKSPAYRVNAEYVVKGNPKPIPKHIPPKLKVMAFDIEVYN